jgi:MOSC domain-containing protein YiiM
MFANGQDPAISGDNLLVDLDLSDENLTCGSQLRLGSSLLEVTPEPHDGCLKFKQRFGADALHRTAMHRNQHLRDIYMQTIEAGEIAVGDPIEVLRRGLTP